MKYCGANSDGIFSLHFIKGSYKTEHLGELSSMILLPEMSHISKEGSYIRKLFKKQRLN
jgi:hypothetical protein